MKNMMKQVLRHELDADSLTGLYAVCMLWLLSLLRYLGGEDHVDFLTITMSIVISWVIAWAQKLLYLNERPLNGVLKFIRELAWFVVPVILVGLLCYLLDWLKGCPHWYFQLFLLLWAMTLGAWKFCINLILKDESVEWNSMLTQFKEKTSEVKDHE